MSRDFSLPGARATGAGTLQRLEALARATDRSRAWLAAHAVRTYLDLNEWQIQAVRAAVERADRRGTKFLSQEEVDAWLATWGTSRERKPPLRGFAGSTRRYSTSRL